LNRTGGSSRKRNRAQQSKQNQEKEISEIPKPCSENKSEISNDLNYFMETGKYNRISREASSISDVQIALGRQFLDEAFGHEILTNNHKRKRVQLDTQLEKPVSAISQDMAGSSSTGSVLKADFKIPEIPNTKNNVSNVPDVRLTQLFIDSKKTLSTSDNSAKTTTDFKPTVRRLSFDNDISDNSVYDQSLTAYDSLLQDHHLNAIDAIHSCESKTSKPLVNKEKWIQRANTYIYYV